MVLIEVTVVVVVVVVVVVDVVAAVIDNHVAFCILIFIVIVLIDAIHPAVGEFVDDNCYCCECVRAKSGPSNGEKKIKVLSLF